MSHVYQWPIRVYYDDTDAGGIVYHANFLKYFERARTEILRQYGFEQDELIHNHNVFFVVRSVTLDYLAPARFNDQIVVMSKIVKSGRASIVFEQNVVNQNNTNTLCEAEIKIACLDTRTFKTCPIPKAINTIVTQEYQSE